MMPRNAETPPKKKMNRLVHSQGTQKNTHTLFFGKIHRNTETPSLPPYSFPPPSFSVSGYSIILRILKFFSDGSEIPYLQQQYPKSPSPSLSSPFRKIKKLNQKKKWTARFILKEHRKTHIHSSLAKSTERPKLPAFHPIPSPPRYPDILLSSGS